MERTSRSPDDERVTVDFQATYAALPLTVRGLAPRLPARVTQLSRTGLRLRTENALAIGASIDISYQVEGGPLRSHTRLQARVVRELPGFRPHFEYGLAIVGADAQFAGAPRSAAPAGVA